MRLVVGMLCQRMLEGQHYEAACCGGAMLYYPRDDAVNSLALRSGVIRTCAKEWVGVLGYLIYCCGVMVQYELKPNQKRSWACLGWKVNWLQSKLYSPQPN